MFMAALLSSKVYTLNGVSALTSFSILYPFSKAFKDYTIVLSKNLKSGKLLKAKQKLLQFYRTCRGTKRLFDYLFFQLDCFYLRIFVLKDHLYINEIQQTSLGMIHSYFLRTKYHVFSLLPCLDRNQFNKCVLRCMHNLSNN